MIVLLEAEKSRASDESWTVSYNAAARKAQKGLQTTSVMKESLGRIRHISSLCNYLLTFNTCGNGNNEYFTIKAFYERIKKNKVNQSYRS